MARPHIYRSFVTLGAGEVEFLNKLQRIVQEKAKLKRPPPLRRVLQAVVFDYCRLIKTGANPELLDAYERLCLKHHKMLKFK